MKKRYIFLFILIFIWSFQATQGNWWGLISIPPLIWVMNLINSVEKSKFHSGGLTRSEKIQVIITEFFNPLVAGTFYYYCWKKDFPKKASQANLYSWIIFGIEILIIFGVFYMVLAKLF